MRKYFTIFILFFTIITSAKLSKAQQSKLLFDYSTLIKNDASTTKEDIKLKFLKLGLQVKEEKNSFLLIGDKSILDKLTPVTSKEVIRQNYNPQDPTTIYEVNAEEILTTNPQSAKELAIYYSTKVPEIKSCKIDNNKKVFILEKYTQAPMQAFQQFIEAREQYLHKSSTGFKPQKPSYSELQLKSETK